MSEFGLFVAPSGRKLDTGNADPNYAGTVRNGHFASPQLVELPKKKLRQADASEFQQRHRRYLERSTGRRFKRLHVDPLALGEDTPVECFLVDDGTVCLLAPAEHQEPVQRSEWGTVKGGRAR